MEAVLKGILSRKFRWEVEKHVRFHRDTQGPKGVFRLQKMEATQAIEDAAYNSQQEKQDRREERKRAVPG